MKLPILMLSILFYSQVYAAPIYSWKDEKGNLHYSDKAKHADAKQAKLPALTRAKVALADKQKPLEGCGSHGGINCQAGSDSDGSVICFDGYREALTRFTFNCSSTKLKISEITKRDAQGRFSVYLRNTSSLKALQVNISFREEHLPNLIQLSGPSEIEAFGLAEYSLLSSAPQYSERLVKEPQVLVSCANCG